MASKQHQEEIEEEEDEGVTEIEYLGALLQTEEGDTIAQVLDRISKHIENQNKLFVKLVVGLEKLIAHVQNGANQSAREDPK